MQCDESQHIDLSQARANYKLIMRRIHTDKNSSPAALLASQCVTTAWRLINDPVDYEQYADYGALGIEEVLNSDEFERSIAFIGLVAGFVHRDSNPTPPETPCAEPIVVDITDDEDNDHDHERVDTRDAEECVDVVDSPSDCVHEQLFVSSEQAHTTSAEPVHVDQDSRAEPSVLFDHSSGPSSGSSASRRQSYSDGVLLERIVDHRDRNKRLKFKVVWRGLNLGEVWEPYDVVKDHPAALKDY